MASFHAKDGYLYIDFRWRGLRCREATRFLDTAAIEQATDGSRRATSDPPKAFTQKWSSP
jgi:hypothetical protein